MAELNVSDIYNKIIGLKNFYFFNIESGEIYVTIKTESKNITVNVESKEFIEYLKVHFHKEESLILSDTIIQSVVGVLKAYQTFSTNLKTMQIYNRIGKNGKNYYYNIDNLTCIKYGNKKPIMVTNYNVKFKYTTVSQVIPSLNTNYKDLLTYIEKYFNFKNKAESYVFTAWLLYCFIPDSKQAPIIHPILILTGKQGSGKTTALDFISRIVSPTLSNLEDICKDEELIVTLSNNYISTFDNIRNVTAKTQDILCRACTGGTVTRRKLYTNNETVSINYKSIIAINGISESLASNSDFLDRTIMLKLKPINNVNRESLQNLNSEFNSDLSYILGCIFNCMHLILGKVQNISIKTSPRFKDFAVFGVAFYEVFNIKSNFIDDYTKIISKTKLISIESNIVIETLMHYIKEKDFLGTASELILTLENYANNNSIILPTYMQPNKISELLSHYEGVLNDVGINIKRKKTAGKRILYIY